MRLLCVRHGETIGNKQPGVYGQTNYDLTDKGRKEAHDTKKNIQSIVERIDAVYSSDLDRAINTAKIICPNKSIKEDKKLREIDFGVATEYKTMRDFENEYPNAVKSITDSYPEGESFKDVYNRVIEKIEQIVENHTDNETILVVMHGGPISCLFSYIEDYKITNTPDVKTSEFLEIKYKNNTFEIISNHKN